MQKSSAHLQKIGIECESIETGESWGVGRFLYKLLEQLAQRPGLAATYRFHLYFKKQVPHYAFLKNPVFVCTVTTPRWAPASFNFHYHIWMIARAYWDGIATLFFPAYMLPMLWFKKSVVMLTEDIWHEMRNPQQPFRYRLAYGIFANWAKWRATKIMAISSSSKRELIRVTSIAPDRIFVNHLAVDTPHPTPHNLLPTPYLLYVAQAFPRRHLRETIQAFEILASEYPDLKLVAIGPDKYRPPLIIPHERIMRKEHVSDDELASLYTSAAALVYVSDREAFGLPPLEALAYGVPSVLSDKPVHREIFGEHAFYARTAAASDIADAIQRAITDTAHREKIKNTAATITARYTWQAHADRWLNIITAL